MADGNPDGDGRARESVEQLLELIGRLVGERQELRGAGAGTGELEANRRALAEAQSELSRALAARYGRRVEPGVA